jgi:GxxExxY protein
LPTPLRHENITENIIGAAYEVHNTLGTGFLEKVYENALAIELRHIGLRIEQQYPIRVSYKGEIVGDYTADIVVEDKVVVELKAVNTLDPIHEVQLVNYLKATGVEVGLLINFGKSVDVRRKIFDRVMK